MGTDMGTEWIHKVCVRLTVCVPSVPLSDYWRDRRGGRWK